LHALVQHQVLQPVLHPRADADQTMTMDQQLPQIAVLFARPPKPREPLLHQQLQNVGRIALVRLLLAHIAGTNLRGIANPHFMAQPLQQLFEPLRVAAGFQTNQRRR
jgi:hypothetical protein